MKKYVIVLIAIGSFVMMSATRCTGGGGQGGSQQDTTIVRPK